MSEPAGAIRYSVLMSQAGDFLGHGYGSERGDPAWPAREAYRVKDATAGGVLQVYKPPKLPTDNEPHNWSFLRPVAQVTVSDGDDSADLPADFGGFEGQAVVRLSGSTSQSRVPVRRTQLAEIYAMRAATPTSSGPPQWYAEEPLRGVTDARGQRWRMAVYPTADQDYTFWVQYYFNAVVTNEGGGDYVYGGQDHPNLFLASVKAWAEVHYDGRSPAESPMYNLFMIELSGAVGRDRRRKGENIGYNGDGRGRVWSGRGLSDPWWLRDNVTVTYGGQTW